MAGEMPIWFHCYFTEFDPFYRTSMQRDASFIEELPAITVYEGEEILKLNLFPSEEQTIPEGAEVEFEAILSPLPGYGEGEISKDVLELDILEGYKIGRFDSVEWLEDPDWINDEDEDDDWKARAIDTKEFLHVFEPIEGVGSYTLRCGFWFTLEESETKEYSWVFPEAEVPVNAVPGLRILSPIDGLAYPLNVPLLVKTTMDKEELLEQWEKIKWKLNGKEFIPDVEKPPFEIYLDHPGQWKLEAELATEEANTGEEIILADTASFEVKPLEISITPVRKVINFNKQQNLPMELSIKANGEKVEKPGEAFVWSGNNQNAVIEPVEWELVSLPKESAGADFDSDSFKSELAFSQTGAATVLATVTMRLVDAKRFFLKKNRLFKEEYEEPVFTFQAVRADSWAVNLGEMNNVKKHFPDKSIAKAYRTYEIASFSFEFSSSTREPHSFNKENGLQPPISLKPALSGDFESISGDIKFNWKVTPNPSSVIIEQELVKPGELVIKPSEPCGYNVSAEVNLDFDKSTTIKLGEISTTAQAVDLFSLIETKVDPSSFTITLGDSKTLRYIVSSLENNPPPTDTSGGNDRQPSPTPDSGNVSGSVITFGEGSESSIIYLLDKSYALSIEQVLWSYEQDSPPSDPEKKSIERKPYEFSSNVPGKIKGQAKGKLEVQELKSVKSTDFASIANFLGNITPKPIQILINGKPLGSEKYHMGQKVVLSYKVEPDDLKNIVWSVENPLAYKSKMNTREVETHTVKNYKVEILKEEDLKQKQIEFYLYDFDPNKVVKNGSFTYKISGKEYVKEFEVSYERPVFTRPTFILEPPGQDVDLGWDKNLNKWRFGFSDKDRPGIYAMGQLVNNTEVNYMFGSYQLISVNAARTFIKFKDNIATNPSVIQQYLQTIKESDSFGASIELWLDTTAPQDDEAQRAIVSSHGNSIIEIANDRPSITLDEKMEKDGSQYYAGGSFVKEEFLVYVFAKPTDLTDIHSEDLDYYQSIWFPVAVYAWSWEGGVTYDIQNGWAVTGANTVNLNEKSIESFSSWSDVAIGDFNPEWSDL
jgi:hypothetical protein